MTIHNCAFAVAVRDLFPKANVTGEFIRVGERGETFNVSNEMSSFISRFDEATPEERVLFPEQSFELEIPDWALEEIDISDVFEKSKTLELVKI